METQNTQPKIEDGQEPKGKPKVMFLEYGDWKQGQHAISAIIKGPGEKRGRVAARIYIEFSGEPKKAIYSAKDAERKNLFPPTEKLWELKKTIKDNAEILYDKVHPEIKALARAAQKGPQSIVQKEPRKVEKPNAPEVKKVEDTKQTNVPETGRDKEIKNIRERKEEKNQEVGLGK